MNIIKPSFIFGKEYNGMEILKSIESVGRTCYKSEDKINDTSCIQFVKNIINRGHTAMLEHESLSVRIICDRGVSHELVRHRIASYAQESTRYCNYSKDKFGNELTFIKPLFWENEEESTTNSHGTFHQNRYEVWETVMENVEIGYFMLLEKGAQPQEARSILPNSLKTEVVATMNLREWRAFFTLRAAPPAHPQMKEITIPMLKAFKQLVPIVFDDIGYDEEFATKYNLI